MVVVGWYRPFRVIGALVNIVLIASLEESKFMRLELAQDKTWRIANCLGCGALKPEDAMVDDGIL